MTESDCSASAASEESTLLDLLERMVDQNCSDLYLVAGSPAMCRVEGVVQRLGAGIFTPETIEALARSNMTENQWTTFCDRLEMNFALRAEVRDRARFRANVFRQRGSVAIVIRRIDLRIPTIEDLGLPTILKDLVVAPRGLILVVGASDSGKSTTLASMIDYRNETMSGHIITVEDPIEYLHTHKLSIVSQREIGFDTRSYRSALRNALRQAPDVLLVGEIRDRATMDTALAVADTGHLCLGTLHSTNAVQTLERIIHFYPEARQKETLLQLSLNLHAVVAQRLPMAVDGRRIAALEILVDTPRVKDLIKRGEIHSLPEAMVQGSMEGCQTFDASAYDLYITGRIDLQQALRCADSTNNLGIRIKTHQSSQSGCAGSDPTDPDLRIDGYAA